MPLFCLISKDILYNDTAKYLHFISRIAFLIYYFMSKRCFAPTHVLRPFFVDRPMLSDYEWTHSFSADERSASKHIKHYIGLEASIRWPLSLYTTISYILPNEEDTFRSL